MFFIVFSERIFFFVSAYSLLLCLFAATILVISEKLNSQNVQLFHWKGQENLKKIAHSTSDVKKVLHSSSDNILKTCNSKVFLYYPFNAAFFFVVVLYETLSVYGFVTPSNQLYLIVDFSASFVFIRPKLCAVVSPIYCLYAIIVASIRLWMCSPTRWRLDKTLWFSKIYWRFMLFSDYSKNDRNKTHTYTYILLWYW